MVLNNGTYYYVIMASDFAENSSISNCENVTVEISPQDPGDLPSAPQLDSIVPNPDLDGVIQLHWSLVADASIYYIYRATSNITSVLGITPIQTAATNSCLDTITTNGFYYYVIVASNGSGNSTPSNCESVQVDLFEIPGFELSFSMFGILLLILAVRFMKRKGFGKRSILVARKDF
jgi:hypothetical protein